MDIQILPLQSRQSSPTPKPDAIFNILLNYVYGGGGCVHVNANVRRELDPLELDLEWPEMGAGKQTHTVCRSL